MIIPENLTEFLYWVKNRTETFWSINPKKSNADFVCSDWIYGAKWIGMSDDEINNIELKYNIKFTKHHKEFLRILHTIDKKEKTEYTETFDEDAEVLIEESDFFLNWNTGNEEDIFNLINSSYESLIYDVYLGQLWLKSWGDKTDSLDKRKEVFDKWFETAPKLNPINGHRFIISEPQEADNIILSIRGYDTIVLGGNLRHYLINELIDELSLHKLVYHKEDKEWYPEPIEELSQIHDYENRLLINTETPYWKEILIYNGFNDYMKKYSSD